VTLHVDLVIRQAMGEDQHAIAWLLNESSNTTSISILVMAAVFAKDPHLLVLARQRAERTRDRQLVEIVRAYFVGDTALVDALARDHLVDFPDSLIVAWIAAGATNPNPGVRLV
jgi:hypothetical protein